jgi:magnesium-transporting ATPase (P-type)
MIVGDNELTATNIAGELMAISIAMAMQRYNAGRIARWSTSRASLEAVLYKSIK